MKDRYLGLQQTFGSSTSFFSASRLQGDIAIFSNAFVSGALSVYVAFELHSSLYVDQFTHLGRSLFVFRPVAMYDDVSVTINGE